MAHRAAARYDVPLGLAAGVAALLGALFFPLAHRAPAWPTEMPYLRHDEAAVLRDHDAALRQPRVPAWREVLRAWDAWSRAADAGDAARAMAARQRFGDVLAEATERMHHQGVSVRALAAERFVAGLESGGGLARTASRHGLVGRWYATRAARLAWFAMRWERNAAPTQDDGSVELLSDTLARVPPSYQRAFASWALSARCRDLVGAADGRRLRAEDVRVCARLRVDVVDVARAMEPRYPRDEALLAAEVMQALGLRAVTAPEGDEAVTVVDEGERTAALADAQAALVRAQDGYARLLRTSPSRRLERRYMAVVGALSAE